MQTFGINLLVSLDLLLNNKLTLDNWFLLYCLANNKTEFIESYAQECGKLTKDSVLSLVSKGFLILRYDNDFSFNSMRLTERGRNLILDSGKREEDTFIELFSELRSTYPKKVPAGNGSFRPLHGDLARCKRLYQKILSKDGKLDISLHKIILKSIEKEIQERIKGKNLPFMQALATYLHQQNYLQYAEFEEEKEVERGDDI